MTKKSGKNIRKIFIAIIIQVVIILIYLSIVFVLAGSSAFVRTANPMIAFIIISVTLGVVDFIVLYLIFGKDGE